MKLAADEGWAWTASILAGVPVTQQVEAEGAVAKLRRRVARRGRFLEKNNVAVLQADWEASEVVALWVHPDAASREEVRRRIRSVAQEVMDNDSQIRLAIVIALRQTPRLDAAYSMLFAAVR